MLTTSFDLARKAGACRKSYKRFARLKGGIRTFGDTTPIPLDEVLEISGLSDCLWVIDHAIHQEDGPRILAALACDFAEHVLPIYERYYPNDNRPREAIRTKRLYLKGKVNEAAWEAASEAAREAARAAASEAAREAAWAAASEAACEAAWAAAREAAWEAAWAAARAAAWEAASEAAREAASEAAWEAEKKWQVGHVHKVLREGVTL